MLLLSARRLGPMLRELVSEFRVGRAKLREADRLGRRRRLISGIGCQLLSVGILLYDGRAFSKGLEFELILTISSRGERESFGLNGSDPDIQG